MTGTPENTLPSVEALIDALDAVETVTDSLPGSEPRTDHDAAQEALATLASLAPEADPEDGLLERIEARLEVEQMPGTRTLRAEEGTWAEFVPGVWNKLLDRDPETGSKTYLLRCLPNAVIPRHRHARDERLLVLEGEISLGDLPLRAGDFHVAGGGTDHPPAHTREGCLILITC